MAAGNTAITRAVVRQIHVRQKVAVFVRPAENVPLSARRIKLVYHLLIALKFEFWHGISLC